jgi:hypothetical protein
LSATYSSSSSAAPTVVLWYLDRSFAGTGGNDISSSGSGGVGSGISGSNTLSSSSSSSSDNNSSSSSSVNRTFSTSFLYRISAFIELPSYYNPLTDVFFIMIILYLLLYIKS